MTSAEDMAAQNFGMDELPPREQRYEMADEYVDVVNQLFDSLGRPMLWCGTASADIYADCEQSEARSTLKASTLNVRGPLNTVRSPQGRPVYVQAGGSPRGRRFAARHADSSSPFVTARRT